ncbi:C39 family peptidase [Altererythrobacter aquiaggeris]|uniref:C39 family peptidase n=1 Tax=Aestuarierythrobacter aquiaggeris TaxID=1898396 RepID=UPI003018064D
MNRAQSISAKRPLTAASVAAAAMLAATAAAAPAAAQTIPIPGAGQIEVKVRSLADLRFQNMTRQSRDLSCGAAAVATLLKHAYGLPAEEGAIIDEIFAAVPEGARSKIAAEGFSLLELKRYVESRGFAAGGFELESSEKLANLKVPVIALINVRGYNHFVVIKRVDRGRVLIADPAFGNGRPTIEAFAGQWNGIILAVAKEGAVPDPEFMQDPTILAQPQDLRSIAVALGTAEITLPGEY